MSANFFLRDAQKQGKRTYGRGEMVRGWASVVCALSSWWEIVKGERRYTEHGLHELIINIPQDRIFAHVEREKKV